MTNAEKMLMGIIAAIFGMLVPLAVIIICTPLPIAMAGLPILISFATPIMAGILGFLHAEKINKWLSSK